MATQGLEGMVEVELEDIHKGCPAKIEIYRPHLRHLCWVVQKLTPPTQPSDVQLFDFWWFTVINFTLIVLPGRLNRHLWRNFQNISHFRAIDGDCASPFKKTWYEMQIYFIRGARTTLKVDWLHVNRTSWTLNRHFWQNSRNLSHFRAINGACTSPKIPDMVRNANLLVKRYQEHIQSWLTSLKSHFMDLEPPFLTIFP